MSGRKGRVGNYNGERSLKIVRRYMYDGWQQISPGQCTDESQIVYNLPDRLAHAFEHTDKS